MFLFISAQLSKFYVKVKLQLSVKHMSEDFFICLINLSNTIFFSLTGSLFKFS